MNLGLSALENENALQLNSYPGRGIVIGLTPDRKHFVQVYWIMGRSENSRNRIFAVDGSFVRTKAFDESKLTDPSLIIYYPIRDYKTWHIVSNGDQTDTVYEYLKKCERIEDALMTRSYEPDGPNFTPRINGIVDLSKKSCQLTIIKKISDSGASLRSFYNYESLSPGFGYCIHTYSADGNPLPSFDREPYVVRIFNSIEANADHYWKLLNVENRISLLVKYIDEQSGAVNLKIINKHK
jgi:IMP cyclohydrolase